MANEEVGPFKSLVAGGSAGFCVDVVLFPLDTIKTRLQSEVGFRAAGGLRSIYSGLGPAALGSAPNAALFFCTYEFLKTKMGKNIPESYKFFAHATAASLGETVACIIRVPTEIVKQRRQTKNQSSLYIFKECLRHEGFRGLYRGYWSTVMREIPFSFMQYPLWEFFKTCWNTEKVTSWQSALSGALAGGISAAITTPLDVAKTRIMLAAARTGTAEGAVLPVLWNVFRQSGIKGLYAGVVPRSIWMCLGGAIYFGVYQSSLIFLT